MKASGLVLIAGMIIAVGGAGGVTESTTEAEFLGSLFVAVVGALMMKCAVLLETQRG